MRDFRLYIYLIFICLAASQTYESVAKSIDADSTRSRPDCDPTSKGALIAHRSNVAAAPKRHVVLAQSLITLTKAQLVQGSCVSDIKNFVAGNARLSSGLIFEIRENGAVKLYPPQGISEDVTDSIGHVRILPGYKILHAEIVATRASGANIRKSYVAIFKGKNDYLIGSFDVIDRKVSTNVDQLIRSKTPISALGFLPAPDTTDGAIGFLQITAPNSGWLYTYDWRQSPLQRAPI